MTAVEFWISLHSIYTEYIIMLKLLLDVFNDTVSGDKFREFSIVNSFSVIRFYVDN